MFLGCCEVVVSGCCDCKKLEILRRGLPADLRSARQLYQVAHRSLVTRHGELVVEHRVCQPHRHSDFRKQDKLYGPYSTSFVSDLCVQAMVLLKQNGGVENGGGYGEHIEKLEGI